jgi:hypothetical protein
MSQDKPTRKTPFWIDTNWTSRSLDLTNRGGLAIGRLFFRWMLNVAFFVVLAIYAVNTQVTIILFCIVGFYIIMIGASIYYIRRSRSRTRNALEIQERARAQTNASHIGSAIHMAGHPLLERDQPVVLALSQGRLSFHDYDSPVPLDTIEMAEILSMDSIGYDNDRVPLRDVLDSSAQVLEITFHRNQDQWICMFRKMRPVRPIDWYHVIQQARYQDRN